MKYNTVNLVNFLMFGTCVFFTQSAFAYWMDVNNLTNGQDRLKITYPGWYPEAVSIAPAAGHRITTNNRCVQTAATADPLGIYSEAACWITSDITFMSFYEQYYA